MDRRTIHDKLHLVLLQGIACSLPFPMIAGNVLIVLALINWLIAGNIIQKIRVAFSHPVTRLMLLFFALHLASVLFSENTTEAWKVAERRLSLVVFPLLVFHTDIQRGFKQILHSFCAGVCLAGLICLVHAAYLYLKENTFTYFLYHQLSSAVGINAVYLSAYAVLAIMILTGFPLKNRYGNAFLIAFLMTLCVLLSSKTMLLILIAYFIIHFSLRTNKRSYQRWGVASVIVLCSGIAFIPGVRNRFVKEYSSRHDIVTLDRYNYDTPFSGTSLRLVLWKHSISILRTEQAWIAGVGSGDFQDKLNDQYRQSGMYVGNAQNNDTGYIGYGPHNQYIETLLYAGITGLFVFLILLFTQLKQAIRFTDKTGAGFILLCLIFFLSESALSTNKGIVFYALFSTLFSSKIYFNRSTTGYNNDFSIPI